MRDELNASHSPQAAIWRLTHAFSLTDYCKNYKLSFARAIRISWRQRNSLELLRNSPEFRPARSPELW